MDIDPRSVHSSGRLTRFTPIDRRDARVRAHAQDRRDLDEISPRVVIAIRSG
jgi:hypothetical protein